LGLSIRGTEVVRPLDFAILVVLLFLPCVLNLSGGLLHLPDADLALI
jgi:hypothetical protein